MDIIEWFLAGMMAVATVLMLATLVMLGAAVYVNVTCYESGDPNSMACYMAKGQTRHVKADVVVR